mmetsp:Transcript_22068/g.21774  ORF Transcript_22068/g.21774 Transcript_22068/m.21774 type:complete len:324 (-) Transcript_22068:33-1004(-)
MEVLIKSVDPFTTEDIEIALSQVSEQTGGQISKNECKELFQEFILDPHKHKKKFAESKKRFDLVWNREDIEQEELANSRFQIYNTYTPVSQSTLDILDFLKEVQANSSLNHFSRREIIKRAQELSKSPMPQFPSYRSVAKQIVPEIVALDPPIDDELGNQDKITLLRAIQKHLGDWDKILKEFKDKPPALSLLKQTWRRLKATMREEVREIQKKWPQYHYIKWIRAAVRKLEQHDGKKLKNRPPPIIDATQSEKRLDILNMMADADENPPKGFQGTSDEISFSRSSSFKKFEKSPCLSARDESPFSPVPIMVEIDSAKLIDKI